MPHLDSEDYELAVKHRQWFSRHETTVRTALEVYERYMHDAAREAYRAFDAGKSDGPMTNEGYRHAAVLFEQCADRAGLAAKELVRIVDGEDEES